MTNEMYNMYFFHFNGKEQLMRKKNIILLVILCIFLIGCATIVKPTFVDPTGRQLPVPHYVLQDMSGDLTFTFYYTLLNVNKDLDGTILRIPTYIHLASFHKIKLSEYKAITLTIEVMNPKKIEYNLWDYYTSVDVKENKTYNGSRLAKSNAKYRQFDFNLPFSPDIKQVVYSVEVSDKNGDQMLNIGDLHYALVK